MNSWSDFPKGLIVETITDFPPTRRDFPPEKDMLARIGRYVLSKFNDESAVVFAYGQMLPLPPLTSPVIGEIHEMLGRILVDAEELTVLTGMSYGKIRFKVREPDMEIEPDVPSDTLAPLAITKPTYRNTRIRRSL